MLLNFLEMCPYELVDQVYFGQLIDSICGSVTSMETNTVQTMLRCVVQNGLTALFIKKRLGGVDLDTDT